MERLHEADNRELELGVVTAKGFFSSGTALLDKALATELSVQLMIFCLLRVQSLN